MEATYRSVGFLQEVWQLAREAGDAILAVYNRSDLGTRQKADDSPVTDADLASQAIIDRGLQALSPDIPRLSEETAQASYAERRAWKRFWLVDPLDGTKEFVHRRDEFTVNIALIEDGRPKLGVVFAPALGYGFVGSVGDGAWRLDLVGDVVDGDLVHGEIQERPIRVAESTASEPKILVSYSHPSEALTRYLEHLPPHALVSMGSSLKFCRLAEGEADFYPRLGPTMEWDTGAAQAVLEAAGGRVLEFSGEALTYNRESLKNPHFVAVGPSDFPWQSAWQAMDTAVGVED